MIYCLGYISYIFTWSFRLHKLSVKLITNPDLKNRSQGTVIGVHSYNPIYVGGRGRRIVVQGQP
jgi:hypothetical protein